MLIKSFRTRPNNANNKSVWLLFLRKLCEPKIVTSISFQVSAANCELWQFIDLKAWLELLSFLQTHMWLKWQLLRVLTLRNYSWKLLSNLNFLDWLTHEWQPREIQQEVPKSKITVLFLSLSNKLNAYASSKITCEQILWS